MSEQTSGDKYRDNPALVVADIMHELGIDRTDNLTFGRCIAIINADTNATRRVAYEDAAQIANDALDVLNEAVRTADFKPNAHWIGRAGPISERLEAIRARAEASR